MNSNHHDQQVRNCPVCTGCGKCSRTPEELSVLMEFELNQRKERFQEAGYLAAVDIGTTTIAMVLKRIADGETIDRFACINPQRKYGFDVISRIQAAADPAAAEEMRSAVQLTVQTGLQQFITTLEQRGEEREALVLACIAANTTMCYLFLGYDPKELGQSPFQAKHLAEEKGEILGIPLLILPGISAFVGADIMAGIYALGMEQTEQISLLVDLGTNGEMVLGRKGKLISASTAAGPAFEGAGEEGSWACDRVSSIARMLQNGIIDETGLMCEDYFQSGYLLEGSLMTQQDVRGMQMAKAAVCGGIFLLCREYGIIPEQISQVFLAGGFGRQLSSEAAEVIGLIPEGLKHKTKAAGNSALQGAYLYGRDRLLQQKKEGVLLPEVENKNLAELENFETIYLNCMRLGRINTPEDEDIE